MKFTSIVRHIKTGIRGVIIYMTAEYAEVVWMKQGMYNPEIVNIKELELIK